MTSRIRINNGALLSFGNIVLQKAVKLMKSTVSLSCTDPLMFIKAKVILLYVREVTNEIFSSVELFLQNLQGTCIFDTSPIKFS